MWGGWGAGSCSSRHATLHRVGSGCALGSRGGRNVASRRPKPAKPRRLQPPGFCGSGCQPIAAFPPWLKLAYSLAGEAVAMGIMGPPLALALYVQQKLADMERAAAGEAGAAGSAAAAAAAAAGTSGELWREQRTMHDCCCLSLLHV